MATTAATSPLHRPDVAFQVRGDDTARHQVERGRQAREHFEDTSPVAAIRNIVRLLSRTARGPKTRSRGLATHCSCSGAAVGSVSSDSSCCCARASGMKCE
ncbi:DUF6192 family protein [Streptomyces sp. NPDC055952]|uniref:DUF6192 family protein n=1 Tax=Streptomyces sp. NPDC055952 TaxID=3345663 RepID=UPI0035E085E9